MKNSKEVALFDDIEFERKGKSVYGQVVCIRENTVMVSVDLLTQEMLNLPNTYTVVNHKNYKVLSVKNNVFLQ